LLQDSLHRIWIGTRDGLNLYDGNTVKVFRPVRGDTTCILGYNVRDIEYDRGHLWINTNEGLSKMSIRKQTFKQFPLNGVLCVLPYGNRLLIGTNRGLFELNERSGKAHLRSDILSINSNVNNLYQDNAGMLWIGTDVGLFKYNPSKKVTTELYKGSINSVFIDSKKRIWIGTSDDGVALLNRQNKLIQTFKNGGNGTLINDIIRDIEEDSKGNIWIGTFLGLSIVNGHNFSITNYNDLRGLSHNSIYSILKDHQGTMWLGTYFGGISYYNPDFDIYKWYRFDSQGSEGTGYRVIGEMFEDKENNLWIATEGGGLDYYNRSTKEFKHFRHESGKSGLSHNSVKSLYMPDNNTLFIGTHMGGLNVMDIKTGRFKHYVHQPEDSLSIPSNVVNSIIPFKDKYLLGTHNGVVEFDPSQQVFSHFFKDKETRAEVGKTIFCLFEDSFGKLWIGTEKEGLATFDTQTGKLTKYLSSNDNSNAISNNTINTIFEDHQFRLWIGTFGGGLNRYNRDADHFTSYTRKEHNLPSDFIYGIQESRYGNLWFTTSKGLVRFDVENNRFYNYHQKNGFPLEELNEGSLFLTRDGELFVGGINGLVSFREEDLLKKNSDFKLLFSSLYVNNIEQNPSDANSVLLEDFAFTNSITLKPGEDVFTIHYAACNYIPSNQCNYQYMLDDFNTDWVNAGTQTSVTYTNLDPGSYVLRVKGLNGVDNSVIDEVALKITVKPPIYQTWYAFLTYAILAFSLLFWLNQVYLSKVRLMDHLKAEKREKEQMKELNQSKLRFFTNISHEFRTPLTLITGSLEAMLEDAKTTAKNYKRLLTINNNAQRLNNLITELLDFRKMEQGFLKLYVSEYRIEPFLDEIYQSFMEYAQHHHVDYSFKGSNNEVALWFDKKQMEKVFYNLLSNAFKFVSENTGKVSMEYVERDSYVDVKVSDNGPGLPTNKVDRIFDRFYQIDRVSGKTSGQGSGIGLALSKGIVKEHQGKILVDNREGEGITFTVRLLKGNTHFKDEFLVSPGTLKEDSEPLQMALETLPGSSQEMVETPEGAPCLLIVEDNEEMRTLVKELLQPYYMILEAGDGEAGLKAALEHQPDLIISDVMMPNMSGTQMCAKIKRNIQTSHIPVILLTARTALEYKIEGLETGADDYITKPFNSKLLRARVKNLLRNRMAVQEKFKHNPTAEVHEVTSNKLDQQLLERAREIINQHLDNTDFNVNDFAGEMGLGRTRLYEKIRGITGQTPNDFILSTRLKRSAELLLGNEDLNVSEIAYAVGFSTPRYFSRCFREHFGVSPSKYGQRNEA
jgi:signal transduction histidine kinase/ligand-binding sensor domain-containing protein/DNA-binding response OmpR family regulator